MHIDKLTVYLVFSLFLSVLFCVSYAGNTPIAGDVPPSDSNSIQTAVPDSNAADVKAVKEAAPSQDDTAVKDEAPPRESAVQGDSNLPVKVIAEPNTAKEEPAKAPLLNLDIGEKIALYIAIGFVLLIIVLWLLLRKTFRTRLRVNKTTRIDLADDTFLIVFDWTHKIFYFPTMIASIVAANLMFLQKDNIWFFASIDPKLIGGIWFLIFFLNFLIEEYNITIMALLMCLISSGFLFLWLFLAGWFMDFLRLFKHLGVEICAMGYLLVSVIGLLTIIISWLKGLFYYVTITPNYINLQEGPTETGEQIGREDYNTRIDTTNFLGRLLGFGKIVITFRDKKRQPLTYLVGSIQKKARLLEDIRSKIVVERSD